MIPIHKCDKQRSSKSLVVFLSTVTLLIIADKKFDVDVEIEKDPIKRDTQDITVTVRNADVKLTVYPPESDATSETDETYDDGKAKFK
jgi:hypothetical protein